MKTLRPLRILFALLVLAATASAKPIELVQEFAQFRADSSLTRLEMYYMIEDSALRYRHEQTRFLAEMYMRVEFTSSVGDRFAEEWVLADRAPGLPKNPVRMLLGQRSFVLRPGQYAMKFYARDLNDSTTLVQYSATIVIRDFSRAALAISDIEFCTEIMPADSAELLNPQFRKGLLYVAPNPLKLFAGRPPRVIAYTEVYNAATRSPGSYRVRYSVLDAARREVFSVPLDRSAVADAQVEKIELPLDALATGSYYLQVVVLGSNGADSASTIKRFFVHSDIPAEIADVATEELEYQSSEFATMSEAQVKKELEYIQYIATEQERESYKGIAEHAKRQKFLFDFWKRRDPVPETNVNERLAEYRKAIDHANTFYSNTLTKEGWRSDRGRILMKYGFPTQIDRQGLNHDAPPHEVWFYPQRPGGGVFVFMDERGIGNSILAYTTEPGESYDPVLARTYQRIQTNKTGQSDGRGLFNNR